MTQVSPSRVKVKEIKQVAIAVQDIEKTVAAYWNILGIGPWEIRTWESPVVYDRKYGGKAITSVERLAHAQVGSVELELCQPVRGNSVYRDFISEHGEGLHHLKFMVDDVFDDVQNPAVVRFQGGHHRREHGEKLIDIVPVEGGRIGLAGKLGTVAVGCILRVFVLKV